MRITVWNNKKKKKKNSQSFAFVESGIQQKKREKMIESYPDNKTSTTTAKIDGLCLGGENVFDSLSLSFLFFDFDSIRFDYYGPYGGGGGGDGNNTGMECVWWQSTKKNKQTNENGRFWIPEIRHHIFYEHYQQQQ